MTKKELEEKIEGSDNKEWFHNCTLELSFNVSSYKIVLTQFLDIYNFFEEQLSKWEELEDVTEITPFLESKEWLLQSVKMLDNLLKNEVWKLTDELDNKLEEIGVIGRWPREQEVYLTAFRETEFLLELLDQELSKDHVLGAHQYFADDLNFRDVTRGILEGQMLAYEFRTKDFEQLVDRKKQDGENLTQLKLEHSRLLKDLEASRMNLATEKKELNKQYVKEFDLSKKKISERLKVLEEEYKGASGQLIQEVTERFVEKEAEFQKLKEDTDQQFEAHRQSYAELLMLKEPAEYWQKRAEELKKVGYRWMYTLVATSIVGLIVIMILIFSLKGTWFQEQIKNPAISIRWSVLSIVLLTLIGFLIRVFTKMMMSNFHLYRDAEERKQLTYLYLSLINEAEISDSDRSIVLQALFTRADTGLLKADSSSSAPSINLNKLNL